MSDPYIGPGQNREHTWVVRRAMGKKLPPGALIHHVDGDGKNNQNTNLVVCPDKTYHALLHARQEAFDATGDYESRRCNYCKQWGNPKKDSAWAEFTVPGRQMPRAYHKTCAAAASAANRARKIAS